jgi:hypothetical protein
MASGRLNSGAWSPSTNPGTAPEVSISAIAAVMRRAIGSGIWALICSSCVCSTPASAVAITALSFLPHGNVSGLSSPLYWS